MTVASVQSLIADDGTAAELLQRIQAAKESNVYVPFQKGKGHHCLLDPQTMNAVPIMVRQKKAAGDVVLDADGTETILRDTVPHQFMIRESEFFIVCRKDKVAVVNFTSGQTGMIRLDGHREPPEPSNAPEPAAGPVSNGKPSPSAR